MNLEIIDQKNTNQDNNNNSLQQIKKAVDEAPAFIWSVDAGLKITYCNVTFLRFIGFNNSKEFSVQKWQEIIHPADWENTLTVFRYALELKNVFSIECRFKEIKSGEYFWTFVQGSPQFSSENKFDGYSITAFNINQRKLYERSVRKNEARFRRLTESSIISIAYWNINGEIEDANDSFLNTFGYSKEELAAGKINLKKMSLPDGHSIHANGIERAVKGQNVMPYEARFLHKNGSVVFVLAGYSLSDRYSSSQRIAFFTNITQRKEAEDQLQQILETLPHLAWALDEEGEILYMNQAWYEQLGIATYISFNLKDSIHPDDYVNAMQLWDIAFSTSTAYNTEYRLRDKDGFYRWMQVKINPIHNGKGRPTMWVATATDIHDQKIANAQLEEKINERTAELKSTNENLSRSNYDLMQFASVASHDLKEPLRKVLFFGDLLKNSLGDNIDLESAKYITKISDEMSRMRQLIEDILLYSKLANEPIKFSKINVAELITQITEDFQILIQEKEAVINVSKDICPVMGHPGQLRQLFQNLISNALKFNRPSIRPVISITSELVSGEEVQAGNTQRYCKVMVQDNGIGLDIKYTDKVFVMFQRLHSKQEYEGTGIGLSIVKKVLDNHKGFVKLESKLGEGSRFILYFPFVKPV